MDNYETTQVRDSLFRTIPVSLAILVSELELNQPELITIEDLTVLVSKLSIKMSPTRVANELSKRGWLLSIGARGVYEFLPGANAGAYSGRDKLLELKAVSLAYPSIGYGLSLSSALYMHGITKQFPDTLQIGISVEQDQAVPHPFKSFSFHKYNTKIGYLIIKNLTVEHLDTVLVYCCSKPTLLKKMHNLTDNIQIIWKGCNIELTLQELAGMSLATKKRLLKLLQRCATQDELKMIEDTLKC